MNEDKVMQIIINLKKFNSDLMDLNIKYAEEIERLKEIIKDAKEHIKINKYWNGDNWNCLHCEKLFVILNGEKNENNSTSK